MRKLQIAILFGGCSEEHDVSVKSAREIANNIDADKYEPLYIGITRSGVWKTCERPCADWDSESGRSAVLSPDRKMHGLLVEGNEGYRVKQIDAVFPVLHGKSGEDGAIQGLFELSGIPYVGCDIQSSAVCMDKSLAYIVARNAGFHTPDFLILNQGDIPDSQALSYPVFVKPARSGSSFGVNKAHNGVELYAAIEKARQYDSKVLIEQAVSGIEVGCAVLGNGPELIVGEVDQISLSHGIFRIHQEEHPEEGSENATITVPADLAGRQARRDTEHRESAVPSPWLQRPFPRGYVLAGKWPDCAERSQYAAGIRVLQPVPPHDGGCGHDAIRGD